MFFRKSICLGTSRVYIKKKNIFLETGVFHSSITHAAKFSIAVATIVQRTVHDTRFFYDAVVVNKIAKYKHFYIHKKSKKQGIQLYRFYLNSFRHK